MRHFERKNKASVKFSQPLISEMAKDDSKDKVDVKSLTSKQYLDKVLLLLP